MTKKLFQMALLTTSIFAIEVTPAFCMKPGWDNKYCKDHCTSVNHTCRDNCFKALGVVRDAKGRYKATKELTQCFTECDTGETLRKCKAQCDKDYPEGTEKK